ncbi:MAG: hypothetical protein M1820_009810 [Bogoriella megaspora]|nr:MAG: hypothetical protein M1820_009810 [Bogoriella megaspora]
MDTTFISILDLSQDALILYSSDSVVDILGHTPDEVVNRSAWEFFHPQEVPVAREVHGRSLKLDKAAALAYCQIKNRAGQWVCCECCFTVVYNVMVCCTSIYRKGMKSQKRAVQAPVIRRLFSSSPNDPRYHMLAHLSAKFNQGPQTQTHEPRAALFLNRFTRTLTIMYATSGLSEIIGISGEDMKGRSFYYCIAENCLQEAVHCLENAKGNDSIAYLRFWFRDPRQDDQHNDSDTEDSDEEMTNVSSTDEETDGGVHFDGNGSSHGANRTSHSVSSRTTHPSSTTTEMDLDSGSNGRGNAAARGGLMPTQSGSRSSSDNSTNPADTHEAIFGEPATARSSASSANSSPVHRASSEPIELEAVVSCTSDGLVVCLRRARPVIPHPLHRPGQPTYTNGLFAAPWAVEPIIPGVQVQQPYDNPFAQQYRPEVQIPQQQAAQFHQANTNAPTSLKVGGPSSQDFMSSIRDTAIFAWALTGINGSLAEYGRGNPIGESQPPDGYPIWNPDQSGHGQERRHAAAPNGSTFENTYGYAYQ